MALTLAACGGGSDSATRNETAATAATAADAGAAVVTEPSEQAPDDTAALDVGSTDETAVAGATLLYVATTGSDSNPGTKDRPLKTILKASQLATPGTTVYVGPGNYAGGITTSKSGTASARIRYVSSTRHRAVLVAAPGSSAQFGWLNTGNYVDIEGFQLDGRQAPMWRNGILTRASYGSINNNYVHHIAQAVPCDSNGGSAINTTYYYYGVQIQVDNNLVHDIGSASCRFIQGVYLGTSGTARNNIVYRVGNAAIHLWHDAHSLIIANNTVYDSGFGIIVGGGDFYHRNVADNISVHNNIVVNNDRGIGEQGTVDATNSYANNLVYNNAAYNISVKSYNAATGTITKDPQFTDAAHGNFTVKSTSPAIGYASPTYVPAKDFRGAARPQGARPDIGAIEYIGADAR